MDNEKIVMGNPTTTPMRIPDWEQTNPNKSDYIKNRPFYEDDNGNVVKKLDEKFIPDSIARTTDVEKLISESGSGSGESIQTDYEQNDATQPDFLKNRPFYKEKILLTEGKVEPIYAGDDDFKWIEGATMPAGELPNIEIVGYFIKILVEVNDNGQISTVNGVFDGTSIMDTGFGELGVRDNLYMGYLEDGVIRMNCYEEIGDVSIKIYTENIKQIDVEFLPSDFNSVPYIAGDGTFSGTPEPSDLPSGPCILYGMLGKSANIYYFENNPTLCNVINDGEGTVKLYWFEEDEDYGTGIRARYICIVNDEDIVEDNTTSLIDLDERAYAALYEAQASYEAAEAAYAEAIEAKEAAAAAADSAGDAVSAAVALSREISEVRGMAEEAMDEWTIRRFIMMDGDDGNLYQVRIDSNGNLTAKIFE